MVGVIPSRSRFAVPRGSASVLLAVFLCLAADIQAQTSRPVLGSSGAYPADVQAILVHPPMGGELKCSEHPVGQEDHVGDALGQDCAIVTNVDGPFGRFPSFFSGSGEHNEDWHSWNQPVLAPFDGVVRLAIENTTVNSPGSHSGGMAGVVGFESLDSEGPIQVGLVHVQNILVAVGDTVAAGQHVAFVGNNGPSFYPHIHVGAVRGDLAAALAGGSLEGLEALQIRFDLIASGRLRGYLDPQ